MYCFHSISRIGDRFSCQKFHVCPQPVKKNDTFKQAATVSIKFSPVCRSHHISTFCKIRTVRTSYPEQDYRTSLPRDKELRSF
jgi:hypothetical protein